MKKYIYCMLLIIVLLGGCRSTGETDPGSFTEAPLFSMIYDSESSPVTGAELTLDDDKSAKTDINGRVRFNTVAWGEHSVTIKKEGYEEVNIIFNFVNRDQVLFSTLISMENILGSMDDALKKGNMVKAGQFRARALKIDSNDIRLKYLNIVYSSEIGEFEEALKETAELKSIYPDDPYLVMTKAKILFYGLNQKTDSIEIVRRFLKNSRSDELEALLEDFTAEMDETEASENVTGETNE